MSISLYDIDQKILELVDAETGEITDLSHLEQLQMARTEKLENVACWVKNLTAEAAALREEEKRLADRRALAQRKADSLKLYLYNALNGEKLETAKCAVTWRKTSSVCITDAAAVAEWAKKSGNADLVTYDAPKISKSGLARVLKQEDVPGAELIQSVSMAVR